MYLSGYEARGGEHIFRFGYVINNFPMIMKRSWHTEPECRDPLLAPIEVTVSHGRIIRYRRVAFSFGVSSQYVNFETEEDMPQRLGFPVSDGSLIYLEGF